MAARASPTRAVDAMPQGETAPRKTSLTGLELCETDAMLKKPKPSAAAVDAQQQQDGEDRSTSRFWRAKAELSHLFHSKNFHISIIVLSCLDGVLIIAMLLMEIESLKMRVSGAPAYLFITHCLYVQIESFSRRYILISHICCSYPLSLAHMLMSHEKNFTFSILLLHL